MPSRGQFVLSDNTCTGPVAPAAACTVNVAMKATTVGTHNATLRFGDNAPGAPHLVTLTGIGDPLPPPPEPATTAVANLSPLSIAFGNQNTGTTSAAKDVTLTNTGDESLTVSGVSLAGDNPGSYAIAANGCTTVAVGADCTVSVTFSPASEGSKPATLRFTHGALGAKDVTLGGTGVGSTPAPAPVASVTPLSLAYGSGIVGTTSVVKLATIGNTGNAPMSLATTLTGANSADFVVSSNNCPATLAAGAQCQVGVAFKPLTAAASKVALLRFTDNSGNVAGSTQDVTLTGSAVAPPPPVAGINVTPNPITLPDSKVGLLLGLGATATFQTVTVTSNGAAPLVIGAVNLTGASDFTLSSNTCANTTRAPGATCQVTIRFQATARSTRTSTLNITSNAPGSPLHIAVSGKGI